MAVNWSALVYQLCQDQYGRQVVVTPLVSQPGAPAYNARGIFDTRDVDIEGGEIGAPISDQQTILDIRDAEFSVVPVQGDLIHIPAEGAIPAEGDFTIVDTDKNGGGETTCTLQKLETGPL